MGMGLLVMSMFGKKFEFCKERREKEVEKLQRGKGRGEKKQRKDSRRMSERDKYECERMGVTDRERERERERFTERNSDMEEW